MPKKVVLLKSVPYQSIDVDVIVIRYGHPEYRTSRNIYFFTFQTQKEESSQW